MTEGCEIYLTDVLQNFSEYFLNYIFNDEHIHKSKKTPYK